MRKLRIRLILFVGLALALGLGVYCVVGIRVHNAQLIGERIITIDAASQIIVQNIHQSMVRRQIGDIQTIVRDMGGSRRIEAVTVCDASGRIHFSANPGEVGRAAALRGSPFSIPRILKQNQPLESGARLRVISTGKFGRSLALSTPIKNETQCHGCHDATRPVLGALDMVFTISDIDEQVAHNRNRAVGFGILTFVLVTGAAMLIVQYSVRPVINRVIEGTRRIHSGDYGFSIPVASKDELGWLAQHFNMMSLKLKKRKEEELKEWKNEMEQQVAAATERLEQVNKDLTKAIEDLQKTDKVKSDLAMVVYHDLRSPLAAIQSCTNVVMEEILGELNPRQKDMLRRVDNDIDKLLTFITDLLELSEAEESGIEGTLQPTQLADILRGLITSFAARAERKDIKLHADIPDELPLIFANQGHMEQVFRNLIGNAIKYTRPGGAVDVKAWDGGADLVVTIRDTGIGIPEEDLPRIFNVFFRAPNAKAMEKVGTGLGLSIVTRIIKDHSGTIEAASREGKGSTFTVKLPKTP